MNNCISDSIVLFVIFLIVNDFDLNIKKINYLIYFWIFDVLE